MGTSARGFSSKAANNNHNGPMRQAAGRETRCKPYFHIASFFELWSLTAAKQPPPPSGAPTSDSRYSTGLCCCHYEPRSGRDQQMSRDGGGIRTEVQMDSWITGHTTVTRETLCRCGHMIRMRFGPRSPAISVRAGSASTVGRGHPEGPPYE